MPRGKQMCDKVPSLYAGKKGYPQYYFIDKFEDCPDDENSARAMQLYLSYAYDKLGQRAFKKLFGYDSVKAANQKPSMNEMIDTYRESKKTHPIANKQWWYNA